MKSNQSVCVLAFDVVQAMINSGVKNYVAWSEYSSHYVPLIRHFEDVCDGLYSDDELKNYSAKVTARYEREEISKRTWLSYMRAANRIREIHDTGKLSHVGHDTKRSLYPNHEKLLRDFLEHDKTLDNPKTKKDADWAVRKYLYWLQCHEVRDVLLADSYQFSSFLIERSGHEAPGSIHNIQLYLKKFYAYLKNEAGCELPYEYVLSLPVKREKRIFKPLTNDEISRVLSKVDRTTGKGKRDYAIILLGLRYGMRAADIAALKLSDIQWREKKITFIQKKTLADTSLPLLDDVSDALARYILEGRPDTGSDKVFLRAAYPYAPLSGSVPIMHMWKRYEDLAGVPRTAGDGRGFHSLRRALGKNMSEIGYAYTDIATAIGHSSPGSARSYISVDEEHLKTCAIPFDSIEPKGEVFGDE